MLFFIFNYFYHLNFFRFLAISSKPTYHFTTLCVYMYIWDYIFGRPRRHLYWMCLVWWWFTGHPWPLQIPDRQGVRMFYACFYFFREIAQLIGYSVALLSVTYHCLLPWAVILITAGLVSFTMAFVCKYTQCTVHLLICLTISTHFILKRTCTFYINTQHT